MAGNALVMHAAAVEAAPKPVTKAMLQERQKSLRRDLESLETIPAMQRALDWNDEDGLVIISAVHGLRNCITATPPATQLGRFADRVGAFIGWKRAHCNLDRRNAKNTRNGNGKGRCISFGNSVFVDNGHGHCKPEREVAATYKSSPWDLPAAFPEDLSSQSFLSGAATPSGSFVMAHSKELELDEQFPLHSCMGIHA